MYVTEPPAVGEADDKLLSVKHASASVILLFSSLLLGAQQVSRDGQGFVISESLAAANGRTGVLEIRTNGGELTVNPRPVSRVEVEVELRTPAADAVAARGEYDRAQVQLTTTGATVALTDRSRDHHSLRYVVTVPHGFDLDIDTGGGVTRIGDLRGTLTLSSGGGSIQIGRIGDTLTLRSGGGTIAIAGGGSDVDVRTGGGSLRIGSIGGGLRVLSGGGSVSVGDIAAAARITTGGGGVVAGNVGGQFTVRSGGGNVTVLTTAGFADIRSGGGTIRIAPEEGATITTGGGDILVRLPAGSGALLDARVDISRRARERGDDYRISADTPATARRRVRSLHLRGDITPGGPRLRLRTTDGNIEVR